MRLAAARLNSLAELAFNAAKQEANIVLRCGPSIDCHAFHLAEEIGKSPLNIDKNAPPASRIDYPIDGSVAGAESAHLMIRRNAGRHPQHREHLGEMMRCRPMSSIRAK